MNASTPQRVHLAVKNFQHFQHYGDRKPIWIKLYNDLLDDYDFAQLSEESRFHLVMIWLLASRHDNRIPHDAAWIGQRINARRPVDLDVLISAGFLVVREHASNVLAETEQVACLDVDVEEEKNRKEKEQPRASNDVENTISEIIRCANRGMIDGGKLPNARPILTSGKCRQIVADWLDAGIAADVCKTVVYERAKTFEPDDRNKQISTLRYFDGAVKDGWERVQSGLTAIPQSPASGSERATVFQQPKKEREQPASQAPRSPGLQSPAGEKLKSKEDIEQERADAWARMNADAAQLVWQECVNEVAALPGAGLSPRTSEAMVRTRFRRRIIDEKLTPKAVA